MMIKHNKSIFSEWKLSKNFVDTPAYYPHTLFCVRAQGGSGRIM